MRSFADPRDTTATGKVRRVSVSFLQVRNDNDESFGVRDNC